MSHCLVAILAMNLWGLFHHALCKARGMHNSRHICQCDSKLYPVQPIVLAAARPAGLMLPSSMELFLPVPRQCPIMRWKHTPPNTPFAANAHTHAPHSLHSWETLAAQSQARGQFGHALLHSLQKHRCMIAPAQAPVSAILASSASLFGRACTSSAHKACCQAPAPLMHDEAGFLPQHSSDEHPSRPL